MSLQLTENTGDTDAPQMHLFLQETQSRLSASAAFELWKVHQQAFPHLLSTDIVIKTINMLAWTRYVHFCKGLN